MMEKSETSSQSAEDGEQEEYLFYTFKKLWRNVLNSILEEDIQITTKDQIKVKIFKIEFFEDN